MRRTHCVAVHWTLYPRLAFQWFPDVARPLRMPCPLKKVLWPGFKVKVFTVVTCYDPIHLLQGCCQHLAGVRHHLCSINLK